MRILFMIFCSFALCTQSCTNKEQEEKIRKLESENQLLRNENYRLSQIISTQNNSLVEQQADLNAAKAEAADFAGKYSAADSINQEQNMVQYLIAKKDDLISKYNIIREDAEGNFILQTANINYNDFASQSTSVKRIPVSGIIKNIFPMRTAGCYTIQTDALQINDVSCFWQAYRYCIIMLED